VRLSQHFPPMFRARRAGPNRHQPAPKVSVPTDIQGGDAVAPETPSRRNDALSVRTYRSPNLQAEWHQLPQVLAKQEDRPQYNLGELLLMANGNVTDQPV